MFEGFGIGGCDDVIVDDDDDVDDDDGAEVCRFWY